MYLHYFDCLCFSKRKDPTENFGEEEPSLGQIYILGFSSLRTHVTLKNKVTCVHPLSQLIRIPSTVELLPVLLT